jgi:hypothetical protein
MEETDLGTIDCPYDNDHDRALVQGIYNIQTNHCKIIQNQRSTIESLSQGTFLEPTDTKEIEGKSSPLLSRLTVMAAGHRMY